METFVYAILDQLALEGPQGCHLSQLWSLLEKNKEGLGGLTLTEPLRQALWSCLLQRLTDVHICRLSEPSPREGEERGKSRRRQQPQELSLQPLAAEEVHQTLKDFHAAEEQGLYVLASTAVRDAVLGLHDHTLTNMAISEPQRKALEAIARARRTGVLRSDLAKQIGMEAKNFHYVIRALEARNLISSQNVNVKNGNSRTTTSILHLPRFRLKAISGLIKEASAGTFVVEDDEGDLKRICEFLSNVPGQLMPESDVKAQMGFSNQPGHKRWRRLRAKLVDLKCINFFSKPQPGSRLSINFLQFQQPYRPPQSQRAVVAAVEEEGEADLEKNPDTVAELGFDYQVINLILEAGPEGIPKHKLASRLGMTNKRATKLLVGLRERVAIQETDEQQGRMQMKVWRAPEELLQQHRSLHAPQVPAGGWRAAVAAAAAAGPELAGDQRAPAIAALPAMQGMLTSVPVVQAATPMDSQPVAASASNMAAEPAPFEFPEIPKDTLPSRSQGPHLQPRGEGAQSNSSLLQLLNTEPQAASSGQGGATERPAGMAADASDSATAGMGMPAIEEQGPSQLVQSGTIQILGVGDLAKVDKKTNALNLERQKRLVECINRDKFMLLGDVHKFFQETEAGRGMGVCDRHTRDRIIDRCIAAGQLLRLLMELPGRRVNHRGCRADVLARVGTRLDSAFLLEVRDHAVKRRREVHWKSRYAPQLPAEEQQQQQQQEAGTDELDFDSARGLPTRPHAGTANIKAYNAKMDKLRENGYLRARMVRVRLLHYFICRLVGLGGHERSSVDLIRGNGRPNPALESDAMRAEEPDLSMALHSQIKELAELAGLRPQQAAASSGTAEEAAPQNSYGFTLKGLWDAMPVDFFFQVVGSGIDKAQAEELCAEDRHIGELEEGVLQELSEADARARLREALDTMLRMGLLEKEGAPQTAAAGPEQGSRGVVYVAQPSTTLELPAALSQAGDRGWGKVEPGGLRVSREYDLTQKSTLDEYWARLEHASHTSPVAMRYCWPARRAPEVVSKAGWQMLRLMSIAQQRQLSQALAAQVERGLDWVACRKIAADLKLSYTQVMRIAAQFRMKERLERLKMGAQPLPPLPRSTLGTLHLGLDRPQAEDTQQTPGKKRRPITEEMRKKRAALAAARRLRQAKEDEAKLAQQKAALAAMEAEEPPKRRRRRNVVRPFKRRKVTLSYEEDRTLLRAWIRWHAVHGVGPDKQCFRHSRRLLPGFHMLETQASRRISRVMKHELSKDHMQRLLTLAAEVRTRAAERAASEAPSGQPEDSANGDGGAAPEQDKAPEDTAAAPSEASNGRNVAPKGAKRKRKRLAPEDLIAKGELVRQLASEATFVAPDDFEEVHSRPRRRQQRGGGVDGSAAAGGSAGALGNQAIRVIKMEQIYEKRMAEIAEAMKEGPLFKVVTIEDEKALKEAEEVLEDLLANMPLQKKPNEPLSRAKKTGVQQVAPVTQKQMRAGAKRKEPAVGDGAAERAKQTRRPRGPPAAAAAAAERDGGADIGPELASVQLSAVFLKGRSLMQQWRSTVGRSSLNKRLAMPAGGKPPSTSVAIAMELIKSLLMAEASAQEPLTPDATTALVRRFSQEEITEAFGYLRKAGHLYHGASNRPFALSDAFKESLQVVDFPPEIFVEAAAARKRLAGAKLLQQPPAGAPEGARVDYSADEEVPSGMVAEALSLMTTGQFNISPCDVMVEKVEADDDEQDPMIGPLSWHIPLRISSGPPPLFATDPRSHLPLAGSLGQEGVPSRAQQPASQRVQGPTERQGPPGLHAGQERVALPVLQLQTEAAHRADAVAASESARAAAEAAAARACAASSGGGAAASALLKDALRLVRDAGSDGLTAQQLVQQLSLPPSAVDVEALLSTALRHGLVRRLGGYLGWSYAAAEYSQRFVAADAAGSQASVESARDADQPTLEGSAADRILQAPTMPESAARPASRAATAATRPSRSSPAPAATSAAGAAAASIGGEAEVQAAEEGHAVETRPEQHPEEAAGRGRVLQPWTDHRGRLNEPFLRSLTQRAVSIVIRCPGIPEEKLVEELSVLSPHSARRLMAMLLSGGLITARSAAAPAAPQPPAIFRRRDPPQPQQMKVVRHFFPNLNCCFGLTAEALFVMTQEAA